jgi:hypothetical protein
MDMADVKPSIWSVVLIFLIVLLTVPAAKYAANKWPVPGLTDLVNAI